MHFSLNYKENRKLWAERVAAFQASGMNQLQWCKQNEISLSALRYWLRKSSTETECIIESESIQFATIDVPGTHTNNSITLEVGFVKIHLASDFDEALLLKAIKTLQRL